MSSIVGDVTSGYTHPHGRSNTKTRNADKAIYYANWPETHQTPVPQEHEPHTQS